jgi:hypothetical protein
MLNPLFRTLVKVVVASLIVGTVLAHFGITAEQIIRELGLSTERIEDYARQGIAWAWPNLLLGSMIIIPVWANAAAISAPRPALPAPPARAGSRLF